MFLTRRERSTPINSQSRCIPVFQCAIELLSCGSCCIYYLQHKILPTIVSYPLLPGDLPVLPTHRHTFVSSPLSISSRLTRTLALLSTILSTLSQSLLLVFTEVSFCKTRSRSWTEDKYGCGAVKGSESVQ